MSKIKRAGSCSFTGFTLIEILVVLAIVIIITGIVISNIGLQRQNLALLHSAQKLSLDFRRAQNYAISSKIFRTSGVPCGWGMHFSGISSTSTSYIIFADLAPSVDCSDRDFLRASNGSEDFETINLEPGIKINSTSGGLTDVVFTPPEPTVKFTSDQIEASITLINRNSATSIVTINKNGFISSP